ncbi:MAG: 1-acyl-sn-glycerol-3-phosphate acyltransferase [Desulfatibacillaceae bacterium]
MTSANKLPKNLRRWMERLIGGSHDHFLCYLPARIGLFTTWMLRLFFSGIRVDKENVQNLRRLQKDGVLVYATKHKSYFDLLCLYTRYRQENAPFPEIGFEYKIHLWQPVSRIFKSIVASADHFLKYGRRPNPYESDFHRRQLLAGKVGFLSIIQEGGFYRQFVQDQTDPVMYLLEMQKSIARPVYIVPQILFFTRKPPRSKHGVVDVLFGTQENPGRLRRMIRMFTAEDRPFVESSEPINLRKFLERPENLDRPVQTLAFELRIEISNRINRHRQSIEGPALKTVPEIKEEMLRSERLQRFFHEHAEKEDVPVQDVYKKADKYLEEISARFNIRVVAFLSLVIRFLTRSMFDGVEVDKEGLKRFKYTSRKGPVILVPSHKSHIDYLILSYVLYGNGLPIPLIAAGKNLSFWPMGPIFRGGGAFFLRRTFKGKPLYAKVFAEYVYKVLSEGFNIEFFIEGGRSRTGKLILPKLGLLSIILDAYKDGACRQMYFQPIYIGYDRVIEEGSYIHELEGGEKASENLSQMVKARRFLKKRYGRIFLRFAEPMKLEDILERFDKPYDRMDREEKGVLSRNLGHRIINAIQAETVVTPHGLVAASTLIAFKKSFSERQLFDVVRTLLWFLRWHGADLSETLSDLEGAGRQALDRYVRDKFLLRQDVDEGEEEFGDVRYIIVENKRPMLEYYKNNCVSFFIPEAYTALSIINLDALQFSAPDLHESYALLQDLFKNEFHYDPDTTIEQKVRKTLKAYIEHGDLKPHPTLPETYNLTAAGLRTLNLTASFLKPYLEAYEAVLGVHAQQDMAAMDRKERGKKVMAAGRKLYKQGEIELREAVSRVYFQNASDFFMSRGATGPQNPEAVKKFDDAIKGYLRFLS